MTYLKIISQLLLLIVMCMFFKPCFSQTKETVVITGKPSSPYKNNLYKSGLYIILQSDGRDIDSSDININGFYSLKVEKQLFQNSLINLRIPQTNFSEQRQVKTPCDTFYKFDDLYINPKFSIVKSNLDTIRQDISIYPILRSYPNFRNLYFKSNSTEMVSFDSSQYEKVLYEWACYILEYNDYTYELHGHTDQFEDNDSLLSLERAKRVKDYLVGLGVPENLLVIKGYGNKQPAITLQTIVGINDNEIKNTVLQINRRVGCRLFMKLQE